MKKGNSILFILDAICADNVERKDLNHLIELTHNYAYTYLKYRYKNLNKVLLAEDVTLKEMAIDAIAPLFARNDAGEFFQIKKSFLNWEPKIDTEVKAEYFLNKLTARSVEKYVSELLRNSDPFFSKILDSINYIVEKEGYKKKQILGTTYICLESGELKMGLLPSSDFINQLPAELFKEKSLIVQSVFDFIKTETQFEQAIPLNALVLRIKQLVVKELIQPVSVISNDLSEVESIVRRARNITLEKMNPSYLQKDKLSKTDSEKIMSALDSIIIDMRDGGINPGLHKYFLEQFTELTFNDYKEKYQNIFEYLFRILKKEIADQLNN